MSFNLFKQQITHPIKYKLFLLQQLPLAFFVGLKIADLTTQKCTVTVKYKWLNKNPFNSMYFAVLSMAAELSTGALAFGNVYKHKPKIGMLVVGNTAEFTKKAVGKISFTCTDGWLIQQAIEQAVTTKETVVCTCKTIGVNEAGEQVAVFNFTWSFKALG